MKFLKRSVKRLLHSFGYQILPAPQWSTSREVDESGGYRLVNYKNSQGQYDIEAYRQEQERGNRKKIERIWTNEGNLVFMSQWLKDHGVDPKFIVCHGTRNGFEQKIFSRFFGCEVIGTEISPTASQFPMTVQADFHEVRSDWDGRADFVYSNSLDHAYDPAKALRAWARSVRNGGFILLEKASDSDPPRSVRLGSLWHYAAEPIGVHPGDHGRWRIHSGIARRT